ncbi:MAG: ABC transporter permease [Deltaproteobacteria bacterium]|nr:ABC transporter permease [Deltaproteobacteria bacterium]MBW2017943.1 ABC transporter permease [Deltaproteobacteria bacterium]MBW2129968.1 ABC transporter permease [Deltaproteobacteria bacterium]MBW2304247.1 ABC transporter permease [Deltaproteobacteria bacterium]
MARIRTWTYPFKHAFRNLFDNRMIHAVSLGTVAISLLLIGAFMFMYVNVSNWVNRWGDTLTMSVYLEDGIDDVTKTGIETVVRGLPHVQTISFVSKEMALKEMREALGNQAGLLEGLSDNPFPASFEILFTEGFSPQEAGEVKERLERIKGVEDVQYDEQWTERLKGVIYFLKVGGSIIGGLLCLAVLFIVTNTIKLAIYSRRDEIEILKIVGATDAYVKMPFLVEGALEGLIGGAMALMILFFLYGLFSARTLQVFGLPVVDIVFLGHGQIALLLVLSLFLGLTGSFIALGRFFRP